jgi:hypothetical protein
MENHQDGRDCYSVVVRSTDCALKDSAATPHLCPRPTPTRSESAVGEAEILAPCPVDRGHAQPRSRSAEVSFTGFPVDESTKPQLLIAYSLSWFSLLIYCQQQVEKKKLVTRGSYIGRFTCFQTVRTCNHDLHSTGSSPRLAQCCFLLSKNPNLNSVSLPNHPSRWRPMGGGLRWGPSRRYCPGALQRSKKHGESLAQRLSLHLCLQNQPAALFPGTHTPWACRNEIRSSIFTFKY